MKFGTKTERVTPLSCPTCFRVNDGMTTIGPGEPGSVEVGDVGKCAYCGTLMVFTGNALRVATQEDWDRLPVELQQLLRRLPLAPPPKVPPWQ